jgi:hypothetical protein
MIGVTADAMHALDATMTGARWLRRTPVMF